MWSSDLLSRYCRREARAVWGFPSSKCWLTSTVCASRVVGTKSSACVHATERDRQTHWWLTCGLHLVRAGGSVWLASRERAQGGGSVFGVYLPIDCTAAVGAESGSLEGRGVHVTLASPSEAATPGSPDQQYSAVATIPFERSLTFSRVPEPSSRPRTPFGEPQSPGHALAEAASISTHPRSTSRHMQSLSSDLLRIPEQRVEKPALELVGAPCRANRCVVT